MPPLPIDSPERLAVLSRTGLLDSPREERFDRITQQVVQRLKAPLALLSVVDAERQFFKSAAGTPQPWVAAGGSPLSHSFCKYVVQNGTPILIQDVATHPLARESPSIEQSGIVSYLGVPVQVDGVIVGSLCATDQCRRDWDAEEIKTLAELAAAASAEIETR